MVSKKGNPDGVDEGRSRWCRRRVLQMAEGDDDGRSVDYGCAGLQMATTKVAISAAEDVKYRCLRRRWLRLRSSAGTAHCGEDRDSLSW